MPRNTLHTHASHGMPDFSMACNLWILMERWSSPVEHAVWHSCGAGGLGGKTVGAVGRQQPLPSVCCAPYPRPVESLERGFSSFHAGTGAAARGRL